jgi:hypothetical protein
MLTLLPALEQYLPDKRLTILTFLAFELPAATPAAPGFVRRELFVSKLPPNSENFHEISSLRTPPANIVRSLEDLVKNPSINSIQCPHEASADGKHFPISTVLYWARVIAIREIQTRWRHAVDRLQAKMDEDVDSVLLKAAFQALSYVPWSGHVPLNNVVHIHHLSAFFTTEWLTDKHELLMLDLLKEDLQQEGQYNILVENTAFSLLLKATNSDQQFYPTKKHYKWLRDKGEALKKGEYTHLATIVNINEVHWVAVIIDTQNRQILYGDPLRNTIPNDLKRVLDWWLGYHMENAHFPYQLLPVSKQSDSFSCGVLSYDALRSFLLKNKLELIDPIHVHNERIRIFLRLIKAFNQAEVSCNPTIHR